ncbi:MAG: hypothetical protein RIB60_04945 [Phycisphaerales bacterium]
MSTSCLRVAAFAFVLSAGFSAVAGPRFDLAIFENDDGVDVSGLDVWVEVDDLGGGQVLFTFGNDSVQGDVTSVYVENNDFLTGGVIQDNASVEYSGPSTPPNPPGSINGILKGAWAGNLFSADPDTPNPVANSLNPGESFGVLFDLAGGATFGDVLGGLSGDSGAFRVAAHIQRLGDSSVWGVTPTPGTIAPLAIAGLAAARRRRG